MSWQQNTSLSNWNYQRHHLLVSKVINICNSYWSKNKWARWKTFCIGRAIKILYQLWKQCKNSLIRYQDKDIDMLKLGCTLPNLAYIRPYKALDAKFYPFREVDKDILEKIWECVVGGPSIVFTSKAVVDEISFRKSTKICESIVGIEENQLLEEIKKGNVLSYLGCDIEVTENLRSKADKFPPIFKNTLVTKKEIRELMKNYAQEVELLSQSRQMSKSSFTIHNGTLVTTLLLIYLQVGLVCKEYTVLWSTF